MHSLLEDYLMEIAKHLTVLPPAQRVEELREMRQHLLNAVVVSQEEGLSEEDSLHSAIEQFGPPAEWGQNLVQVWQRGERIQNRRSFWGAAVCVVVVSSLGNGLLRLLPPHLTSAWCWVFVVMVISGAISGMAFPRRAASAVSCAMALLYLVTLYPRVFAVAPPGSRLVDLLFSSLIYLADGLLFGAITVLAAWGGSRWRAHGTQISQG